MTIVKKPIWRPAVYSASSGKRILQGRLLNSDGLFIARKQQQKTEIVKVSAESREMSRDFLLEVGAKLSDVFGADSVLWVEGKTEENCFPIVLREIAKKPFAGVQIVSLIQTGDLNKKDATRILNIYASLSRGPTLMPQALTFVLDDEGRPQQDKDDLNKLSKNKIRWLPRRLFENYLLDSAAISQVINECDAIAATTPNSVQNWILDRAENKKYWKEKDPQRYHSWEWQKHVHAAELLYDIFQSLTDSRVEYDKVKHGLKLTEILVARNTDDMNELADFLAEIVSIQLTSA